MAPITLNEHPHLSAEKQALLARRRRGRLPGAAQPGSIPKRPQTGPAPLSFSQERLWLIHLLNPGSAAYHMPTVLKINGRLDPAHLEAALNALVARHEILRTTVASRDGDPVQIIAPSRPRPLRVVDLTTCPGAERPARAEEYIRRETQAPFELERGPLLRHVLLRLNSEEHWLVTVQHHLISDGWSTDIFYRELEQLYRGFRLGQTPSLPELPIQYADFAAWQRDTLRGEALERHTGYWRSRLAGAPSAVSWPANAASSPGEHSAETVSHHLPLELCESLQALALQQDGTLFMVLMVGLAWVLSRWAGQTDLILGTVVAGRTRRELEPMLGCFMNFLPLRIQCAGAVPGAELLARVKTTVLEAYAHQDCPFEKIVEAVNPVRGLNRNPLFNVALLLQNHRSDPLPDPNWMLRPNLPLPAEALLDLRLVAETRPDGLRITCEYDASLFEADTIRPLLSAYRETLEGLARAPGSPLSDPASLPAGRPRAPSLAASETPFERLAVAATFTAEPLADSARFWLAELNLPLELEFAPYQQVFQSLLDPASLLGANRGGLNVVLLRWEDLIRPVVEPRLTAGVELESDLERPARELLQALKAAVTRGESSWLIILCPASREFLASRPLAQQGADWERLYAAELGALARTWWVAPADLFRLYPVEDYDDPAANRLGHVPYTPAFFAVLGTWIVRKFHALKAPPKKVIALDCDQTLWGGVCGEDGPHGIELDPPRLALQRFMREQQSAGKLLCLCSKNQPEDVAEVFRVRTEMPLRPEHFAAERVNWRPKSENLRALARELNLGLDSFILVDDNPVECAEVEAACPEVAVIQLPGDPGEVPRFLQHVWVFDQLNATEADQRRTELYQQQRARARSEAGAQTLAEFIAGLNLRVQTEPVREDQLDRVAQMTQRTNQFNCTTRRRTEAEVRARWRAGNLIILATTVSDRFGDYGLVGVMMCEVRENALSVDTFLLSCRALNKGVEHAMLACLGRMAVERGLDFVEVPFLPSPKNQPALDFLRHVGAAFQSEEAGRRVFRFPAGVAAAVVFQPSSASAPSIPEVEAQRPAESAPVTAYQRYPWLARHAADPGLILQLLEAQTGGPAVAAESAYEPPATPLQQRLCELWGQCLRRERVGVRDDFFALGGNSLMAVRMLAQFEKMTGHQLPLATLFRSATIAALAAEIERENARASASALVPIQRHGTRPPLFLVHGAGGGILWGYANLAAHLGEDQPVYGLEPGHVPPGQPGPSVEVMAASYLRDIRALRSQGPYYLGGYCFGGYVAYEMACQLAEAGERVALVALLDSAAPNSSYDRVPWRQPGFYPRFVRNLGYWWVDFLRLSPEARGQFFWRKLKVGVRKLFHRQNPQGDGEAILLEEYIDPRHFPEFELNLWQAHLSAGAAYHPRPYAGRVTLLRTHGQPLFCSLDPQYGWGELARGGVDVHLLSGAHENIFLEPELQVLARELTAVLRQAGEAAATPADIK